MSGNASQQDEIAADRLDADQPADELLPQRHQRSVGRSRRLIWRVLSVPVFVKVLGIGLVVGTVFGTVTLLQVRGSISRGLQQMLEQRTRSLASELAASLERPLSVGDFFSVAEKLRRTQRMFSDIRYMVVWDAQGSVVASTFEKGVPADLRQLHQAEVSARSRSASASRDTTSHLASNGETFAVFATGGSERVFHVSRPILEGQAGMLQLGVTDRAIRHELSEATRSLLWTLASCGIIGAVLALLMTHLLTHPVRHLVEATHRIRSGDFGTRAWVFSGDEIGRLAAAFNEMAVSLDRYRREVEDKERARQTLIHKIVQTQEEERRVISRELHDQLGQSLLALLLTAQGLQQNDEASDRRLRGMELQIRQMVQDVRRLASGMRPSILDDYGLDKALARHLEQAQQHSGLTIDYQYLGPERPERLPEPIELTLYRITQEALTNATRHAEAHRVSVVVLQSDDEVKLILEDDGQGFDPSSLGQNGCNGLGLTSMRERTALCGGTFLVESTPGHGTTIRVAIPLDGDHKS